MHPLRFEWTEFAAGQVKDTNFDSYTPLRNGRCWRKAANHAPGCFHEARRRSPD
jgi:hypothetical protein